jgi:hypothetical protein
MANYYTLFSEVLPNLTPEEEAWLRQQLELVDIHGNEVHTDDEESGGLDDEHSSTWFQNNSALGWVGSRFYLTMPQDEPVSEGAGGTPCEYSFDDDDRPDQWGRHLWLYSEQCEGCGDLEGIAHLVQQFLKQFRPDQCWSLEYAASCSNPRVGEFGGGAVFVTAGRIRWMSTGYFRRQQHQAFLTRQRRSSS